MIHPGDLIKTHGLGLYSVIDTVKDVLRRPEKFIERKDDQPMFGIIVAVHDSQWYNAAFYSVFPVTMGWSRSINNIAIELQIEP